jgi:hypothetical protein
MKTIVSALFLALIALAEESPARQSAQVQEAPPQAGSQDAIVVRGRREPNKKDVRALASAITPAVSYYEPIARFRDPVCFGTAGLSRPILEEIGHRLAWDAHEAGIPLAGDKCTPNILIFFGEDGRKDLAQIRTHQSWIFGNLSTYEINRVINQPGPVHAWNVFEVQSSEGYKLQTNTQGVSTLYTQIASIIVLPIRHNMKFSAIMIDRSSLVGLSSTQIADYVAMRMLARTRPEGARDRDTILKLFDPASRDLPSEMTSFDRGYLKSIYTGADNQRSSAKIHLIAQQVVKDARKDNDTRANDGPGGGKAPSPPPRD